MTDTKENDAPERIWAHQGRVCAHKVEPFALGVEYVRADLLADMTRQRDVARAEGFAAGLEAAMKEISDLASLADIPGGCLIPDTYDEGAAAAFGAVDELSRALAEGAKP